MADNIIPIRHDLDGSVGAEPGELAAVKAAAPALADMTEVDRSFFLPRKAEELGVTEKVLKAAVRAIQNDRSQKMLAKRLEEERVAKSKQEAAAEKQRELDLVAKVEKQEKKEADKAQTQAEKAAKKEEKEAAAAEKAAKKEAERVRKEAAVAAMKEAARKEREKQKSFTNILKLPVDRHAGELNKLATRLSEDLETLHQQFRDFAGVADGFSMLSDVEPWPEAVDTATLLQAIDAKISKYVVTQQHQRTAVTLWVAMSWVHNEIATYSPILLASSVNPFSGKSTLLGAVARLVPKPSITVEANGANVYRFVDAHQPTMILDEADDIFTRKSDLKHIINASWTRGATIPRQVNISGISVTVFFKVFCPKALGLIGGLPRALQSRAVEIRMAPKTDDEKVEVFRHVDDTEFATLRRQMMRWSTDNAAKLKNAEPMFPSGMSDRPKMNWQLLLAIAELAGGDLPELARDAASRLTRSGRRPSDSVQLLGEFKRIADAGKRLITSKDVITELRKDPTAIWSTINHGGPITERNVAHMLEPYGLYPQTIHPTKRAAFSPRGYVLTSEEFVDAFLRYVPKDPHIRTLSPPVKRVKPKSKKPKSKKPRK